MMAARFLRRSAPMLRQARCYAEAVSGGPQMSFTFASPTQVFFQGASVKQVDVPTLTGAFGILPAHVPTLQVLRPGVVTVYSDEGVGAKYFGGQGQPGEGPVRDGRCCRRDGQSRGADQHRRQRGHRQGPGVDRTLVHFHVGLEKLKAVHLCFPGVFMSVTARSRCLLCTVDKITNKCIWKNM
uniref:ATP synthase F(1) complex subunit delta, mitochondrial n=1 Tax=Gadus morhua TaxID=8049 RepID=A0A8C5CJ96_GADMO